MTIIEFVKFFCTFLCQTTYLGYLAWECFVVAHDSVFSTGLNWIGMHVKICTPGCVRVFVGKAGAGRVYRFWRGVFVFLRVIYVVKDVCSWSWHVERVYNQIIRWIDMHAKICTPPRFLGCCTGLTCLSRTNHQAKPRQCQFAYTTENTPYRSNGNSS